MQRLRGSPKQLATRQKGKKKKKKCHVILHLMLCQSHLWAPLGRGEEESTY